VLHYSSSEMSKFPVRTQRPWFELPLKPSPFSKKEKKVKKERKVRGLEKVPKAPTKCLCLDLIINLLEHVEPNRREYQPDMLETPNTPMINHTGTQQHVYTCISFLQDISTSYCKCYNSSVRLAGRLNC
jgi:hypothetical protein